MQVYRIAQEIYAADLSGKGAWLYGGRWNSEGRFAVYTASSRSLALLETLAHTIPKVLDKKEYLLVTISIPDAIQPVLITPESLPLGWDAVEAPLFTKRMGDLFIQNASSLLLAVPSVMMPEEVNYIINPYHPDMKKVTVTHRRRVRFDKRLPI